MANTPQAGGTSALPIAAAFLATGGRLSVSPEGQLETSADLTRIFGAYTDPREARRSFIIGRRLHRRLRNPHFARSVKSLVAMNGERSPNGWLVMEGH